MQIFTAALCHVPNVPSHQGLGHSSDHRAKGQTVLLGVYSYLRLSPGGFQKCLEITDSTVELMRFIGNYFPEYNLSKTLQVSNPCEVGPGCPRHTHGLQPACIYLVLQLWEADRSQPPNKNTCTCEHTHTHAYHRSSRSRKQARMTN